MSAGFLFIAWALSGISNPRRLISFALYLFLHCTLTKLPDFVCNVGRRAGLLLQRELWPISFNPGPLSSSQRNAEPRCNNTNSPRLLLSNVNKGGRSCDAWNALHHYSLSAHFFEQSLAMCYKEMEPQDNMLLRNVTCEVVGEAAARPPTTMLYYLSLAPSHVLSPAV